MSGSQTVAAVVVAALLVGAGSAEGARLLTGRDVKNSSLTGTDIKNRSLTATDFKPGSLTVESFSSITRQALRGPAGETGPAGAAGRAGTTGAKGDKGDAGTAGPAGVPGPTGPPGAKGDQGDPGTPGAPGALSVARRDGPGGIGFSTAPCLPGETVTGGGFRASSGSVIVSEPTAVNDGWFVQTADLATPVQAFALCAVSAGP